MVLIERCQNVQYIIICLWSFNPRTSQGARAEPGPSLKGPIVGMWVTEQDLRAMEEGDLAWITFVCLQWTTKTEKVSTCDSLQWLSGCVLPGIPRNGISRERSYKNILLVTGKANTMDNCFNNITLGHLTEMWRCNKHTPFYQRNHSSGEKIKSKLKLSTHWQMQAQNRYLWRQTVPTNWASGFGHETFEIWENVLHIRSESETNL